MAHFIWLNYPRRQLPVSLTIRRAQLLRAHGLDILAPDGPSKILSDEIDTLETLTVAATGDHTRETDQAKTVFQDLADQIQADETGQVMLELSATLARTLAVFLRCLARPDQARELDELAGNIAAAIAQLDSPPTGGTLSPTGQEKPA